MSIPTWDKSDGGFNKVSGGQDKQHSCWVASGVTCWLLRCWHLIDKEHSNKPLTSNDVHSHSSAKQVSECDSGLLLRESYTPANSHLYPFLI